MPCVAERVVTESTRLENPTLPPRLTFRSELTVATSVTPTLPDTEMSSSNEKLCLVLVVVPLVPPLVHVTELVAVPPEPMTHESASLRASKSEAFLKAAAMSCERLPGYERMLPGIHGG